MAINPALRRLLSPAYRWIDYDHVCALRSALPREHVATSRHFGVTDDGFTAVALDAECDLPVYIGVRGDHPEHGEIAVFWPRDTAGRDHGYWTITKAA
jgi:hypothetical protein